MEYCFDTEIVDYSDHCFINLSIKQKSAVQKIQNKKFTKKITIFSKISTEIKDFNIINFNYELFVSYLIESVHRNTYEVTFDKRNKSANQPWID